MYSGIGVPETVASLSGEPLKVGQSVFCRVNLTAGKGGATAGATGVINVTTDPDKLHSCQVEYQLKFYYVLKRVPLFSQFVSQCKFYGWYFCAFILLYKSCPRKQQKVLNTGY